MLQLYSSKCPRPTTTWSKHWHAGRCGPRTGFVWLANAFCITYFSQSHKDIVLEQRFQNFLSATQIWICQKPRVPCLKQHMIKIIIVWMILSSKLLGLFSLSAIYSFIKYLHYRYWDRQRQAVVMVKIYNQGIDRLGGRRDLFLTLCDPCLGCHPYFGNHCIRKTAFSKSHIIEVQVSMQLFGGYNIFLQCMSLQSLTFRLGWRCSTLTSKHAFIFSLL